MHARLDTKVAPALPEPVQAAWVTVVLHVDPRQQIPPELVLSLTTRLIDPTTPLFPRTRTRYVVPALRVTAGIRELSGLEQGVLEDESSLQAIETGAPQPPENTSSTVLKLLPQVLTS